MSAAVTIPISARRERARQGWGDVLPDWIDALVVACDHENSQRRVAERIKVSTTLVSQAISNTYTAPLDTFEARVRAIYLTEDVECPGLGTITSETCLTWRDTARAGGATNPLRARMRRACHACPNFTKTPKETSDD